jgi:hypothetical protein
MKHAGNEHSIYRDRRRIQVNRYSIWESTIVRNEKLLLKVGIVALSMQFFGCTRSEVSYSSDIQPIFDIHCIECHNGGAEGVATSGFSVRDYDSVMKGTKFGKVVIRDNSAFSTLYRVVAQKTAPEIQMPPHHSEAWAEGRGLPLSEHDVGLIQAWIDQGAQDN